MNDTECIQTQANKMIWAEQVESRKVQNPSLFYIFLKKAISDTASMKSVVKPMHISHVVEINCKNTSQGFELLVILY